MVAGGHAWCCTVASPAIVFGMLPPLRAMVKLPLAAIDSADLVAMKAVLAAASSSPLAAMTSFVAAVAVAAMVREGCVVAKVVTTKKVLKTDLRHDD